VDYNRISTFLRHPPPALERVFELACKKIMDLMQQQQENQNNTEVRFRYLQTF
jgi:hypothetical protein